jgi:hypothetical protein
MNFKKGSVVTKSGGKPNFLTLEAIWLTAVADFERLPPLIKPRPLLKLQVGKAGLTPLDFILLPRL